MPQAVPYLGPSWPEVLMCRELSRDERKGIRKLVTEMCANYDRDYLADHAGTGRKSPDGAGKESSVRQGCRAVSLGPHWPEVFCSPKLYGGLPDNGDPDGKEVLCRKK